MILTVLAILGLCLGSFVNAFVWRLHEGKDWLKGRSECVNCHHQLAAKDLVPVFSWLSLRGRCRYCYKAISVQYPLIELLMAGLYTFSYYYWPLALHGVGLFQFVLWLIFLVGFASLALYDLHWQLLPNKLVYPLIALALIQILTVSTWNKDVSVLLGAVWGALVLGGLFYVLFQLSKGKWIGGGDVKLGALLGLIIGGPVASVLLMLIASVSGTFYALPFLAKGQAKRDTHIPFGPFLIIGAIIVQLFGTAIISWYRRLYL